MRGTGGVAPLTEESGVALCQRLGALWVTVNPLSLISRVQGCLVCVALLVSYESSVQFRSAPDSYVGIDEQSCNSAQNEYRMDHIEQCAASTAAVCKLNRSRSVSIRFGEFA